MNKRRFRVKLGRIAASNSILLAFNFIVFAFVCDANRLQASYLNLKLFDYVLLALTDHYYVLYCLLPVMLVVISRYLINISDIERLRYQSDKQLMRVEVLAFLAWFALYILLHAVIAIVMGIRTLPANLFATTVASAGTDETLLLLSNYTALSPISLVSILAALVYYCFGFGTIISLLSIVRHRRGINDTIVAAVAMMVLTFVGFSTGLTFKFPYIFPNNYIILHHSLIVNGLIPFMIMLFIGAGVISYGLGFRLSITYKATVLDELAITRRMKLYTALFILAVLTLEITQMLYEGSFNPRDLFFRLLLGSSQRFSSFFSWLKLSLFYLLPLFFIGMSLSKITQMKELPIFIRYGSFPKLNWEILSRYFGFYLRYLGVLIVLMTALFFLGDSESTYAQVLVRDTGYVFTTGTFLGFMVAFAVGMVFYLSFFLIIGHFFSGLVAFVATLVLSFILFLAPRLDVFGLNLGVLSYHERIEKGNLPVIVVMVVLAAVSIGYLGIAKWRTYAHNQIS